MKEIDSIIAACLNGKRSAQHKLYEHYAGVMFGICLRYTGNRADAEDVLQDGFIKIFNSIKSFRQEGSFEGWMRRIIVNTALNFLRQKKRENFIEFTANHLVNVQEDEYFDPEIEPQQMMKLIQNLPIGCRTVFNMYAFEDFSHKEIALQLGISEGTSKSQLSRARKMLTEAVAEFKRKNDYQLSI